jgi:hypothetical protein
MSKSAMYGLISKRGVSFSISTFSIVMMFLSILNKRTTDIPIEFGLLGA